MGCTSSTPWVSYGVAALIGGATGIGVGLGVGVALDYGVPAVIDYSGQIYTKIANGLESSYKNAVSYPPH